MSAAGSNNERSVLVLGGAGFIGRHAVAALCARGCMVVIGSRHPARIDAKVPEIARQCERRTARFEQLIAADAWNDLLAGIDVVVNCVGILRERGRETYEQVHHFAPAALAEACRRRGIGLVHVSALGLQGQVGSRFLRSKVAGEHAIRSSGADWRVVRPSLLDGEGGFGAWWLRQLAKLPVHAYPADAQGRIAALHVEDLAEALARLAIDPPAGDTPASREFELGGPQAYALAGYLAALRGRDCAPAWQVPVPGWIARVVSHVCDLFHFSPFSYGHWELLRRDNVPAPDRLIELLQRPARAITASDAQAAPSAGPALACTIALAAAPANAVVDNNR